MTEPEEGTEAAAVEETVEESAVEESSSEETENTEREPENRVPQSRFSEVVRERNEAREALASLKEEIEGLKGKLDSPPKGGTAHPEPPAHLDELGKVQFYVEHYGRGMIERELGMSLKDAKELLATSKNTTDDYTRRTWETTCRAAGLDPDDKSVQALVGGLMQFQNMSVDAAAKEVSKLMEKGAQKKSDPPKKADSATVENEGVTGTMAKDVRVPRTTKEAVEMAKKGIRAPDVGVLEIIAARRAKRG